MLNAVNWFEDSDSCLVNSSLVTELLGTSGKKTSKLSYQVMQATAGIKNSEPPRWPKT